MRFSTFSAAILLLPSFASSIAVSPSHEIPTINSDATFQILEKRRGGGGSGGRGGGSSGSGGRGGGSGASTGVRGGGTTSASPGYTRGGSPAYAGGAGTPYRAGGALPRTGISPIFLYGAVGFGSAALLYSSLSYYYYGPYGYRYPYYNSDSRQNESLPISCVCAQYNPCGCDDIDQKDVVDQQLEDGTANITAVNSTRTVVINGTLENGTDGSSSAAATAALLGGGLGGVAGVVWPVAVLVGGLMYTL